MSIIEENETLEDVSIRIAKEANRRRGETLLARAKEIATKIEARVRELMNNDKGPPSSAAPNEPATLQFA
ncbi:MAG TPA: hypothetical protein VGL71_08555 [Urbifossiella sp.]|jgi:hypothetical protein